MRPRSLVLLPLLAGCYVYQPVRAAIPQSGELVRLTLTDSGTANLAAQLGPSTEAVSGRMVGDSADSYLLAVSETRRRSGVEMSWSGERVAVARPLVATTELRRFSRNRTVLLGVAAVVAGVVAREAFWGEGGIFGGAPPGPGPGPR